MTQQKKASRRASLTPDDELALASRATWRKSVVRKSSHESKTRSTPSHEDSAGLDPRSVEAFVKSTFFEVATGISIGFSVLVIVLALETDGRQSTAEFVQFAENLVTMFFLLEWALRVKIYGLAYFKDLLHIMDTFIVFLPGVVVVWILQPLNAGGEFSDFLKTARTFRILRLAQLVRVFKDVPAFTDLWTLIRGLLVSGSTLASALILIIFTLYLFAIFACDLIGNAPLQPGASEQLKIAQSRFRGIGTAMLTLTRFMNGDDSQNIMDDLMEGFPYIWLFLWMFTALASFVLLNLVTAVIVQQALEISQSDDAQLAEERKLEQQRELKDLEEMFINLDEDGSGEVSKAEFEEAFRDPQVAGKFALLGFKKDQALQLFDLLDTGGEGNLDLNEFMQGMRQAKGQAQNKDMVLLIKGLDRINKNLGRIKDDVKKHAGTADVTDNEDKARKKTRDLRDKLHDRLQKTEASMKSLQERMHRLAKDAEAAASKQQGTPRVADAARQSLKEGTKEEAQKEVPVATPRTVEAGAPSSKDESEEAKRSKETKESKERKEGKERQKRKTVLHSNDREHRKAKDHSESKESKESRSARHERDKEKDKAKDKEQDLDKEDSKSRRKEAKDAKESKDRDKRSRKEEKEPKETRSDERESPQSSPEA